MSASLAQEPAEGVGIIAATGQATGRQHQRPAFRTQQSSRTHHRVPRDEVANGDEHRTIGGGIQSWGDPCSVLPPRGGGQVAVGAVRHDIGFGDHANGRHPRGREDPLAQELVVRTPRHARDDDAQQHVAGVGVIPARPRGEFERQRRRYRDQLGVGVILAIVKPIAGVVGDTAAVTEQMTNRDGLPTGRHLGEIVPHRTVERDLAVLDQRQHTGRRELLAQRTRLKHRGIGDGRTVLQFSHAETTGHQQLTATHHGDRESGNAGGFHRAAHERIHRGRRGQRLTAQRPGQREWSRVGPDAFQRAAAIQRAALHDVRDGAAVTNGLQRIRVEHHQIGDLAGFKRSQVSIESDRARAFDCGHAQDFVR